MSGVIPLALIRSWPVQGATLPVPLSSENTFHFHITTKILYIFSRFLSLIYVLPKLILLALLENSVDFVVWVRTGQQRNRGSNPDSDSTLPYLL